MRGGLYFSVLVLSLSLSLSYAVLRGGPAKSDKDARHFVKRHAPSRLPDGGRPRPPPPDLRDRLSEGKPFAYPAAHVEGRRHTRSVEDRAMCGLKPSSLLETDPVSQ